MLAYRLPAFISFWIMFAMCVTSQIFFLPFDLPGNFTWDALFLYGVTFKKTVEKCLREFSSDRIYALLVHAAAFLFSNMEPLISQLGHGIMHQRGMTITGNGSNQFFSAPFRLLDHRHLGVTSICVASLLCSANITQKYWLYNCPNCPQLIQSIS